MGNKVFVGGLSWDTDDRLLREGFERFGSVRDAKVVTDRDSGRSKGFGFVTFDDNMAASKAITDMNGADFDGRAIRVSEAIERERR